jgi:hypothetical protein
MGGESDVDGEENCRVVRPGFKSSVAHYLLLVRIEL